MEGLIFGRAYVPREICIIKSVWLACSWKEIYHFCFVLLCTLGQILSTSPLGAYIWRGDLTEGFLHKDFGGLIFGGAYAWRGLFSEFYSTILTEKVPSSFIYLLLTKYGTPLHTYSLEPCMIPFYYIDTDKIPGFFLLLKNHIFITRSEDTIFIFHVWGYWGRYGY